MQILLKIEIKISGESVCYRILDMDESLRITDSVFTDIFISESTGMSIRGYQFPEIKDFTIYLRGSMIERDESYFVAYPFRHSAEELSRKVALTLTEYIINTFGKNICVHIDGDIFTFINESYPQGYTQE